MRASCPDTLARRALFLAAPLLIIAGIAWATRDCVVDDAYIGYQHVRNLLAGHGLQFSASERVEGVTNSGWLLLLAALSPIAQPVVSAKVVGLLSLLIATVWCFGFTARFFRDDPNALWLALPVALLTATQFETVYYAVCGMESGLLAVVLCAMVWLVASGRLVPAGILGGAAFLVRPECLLLFPLWWGVALKWMPRSSRSAMVAGLIAYAVVVVAITAGRFAYYGDLVPNTFYSKPSSTADLVTMLSRTLAGTNPNLGPPFAGVLALPVLGWGAWVLARRLGPGGLMIGIAAAVGWLFSTYAIVDWTRTARYFAPYAPLGFVVLWVGLVEACRALLAQAGASAKTPVCLEAMAGLLLMVNGLGLSGHLSPSYLETHPGYVLTSRTLVQPCLWMRDNIPPDATIATRRIGAVGYLTERRVFDYCFGLIHRPVARLIHEKGKQFDDPHDPALAPLWRRYAPQYILEDQDIMERIAADGEGTLARFEVHGAAYGRIKAFRIGRESWWILCRRLEPHGREGSARPESDPL